MTICRITDENVYNPWDEENGAPEERSPLTLMLGELMAEDFYPYITKNKNWGFDLSVEGDNVEMEARKIDPKAAESLALFCRRFLNFYDKAAS